MTENTDPVTTEATDQESQPDKDTFECEWIAGLLSAMNDNLPSETSAALLRECAGVHYRALHIEKLVAKYRGDLEGFIQFLSEKWQWKVTHDPELNVITVDENKDYCICPLVRRSPQALSGTLCHCSEGFNERMFSGVIGSPVKATVQRSILRGDKSCVYTIEIL